jgi:signal transduction histidine kinase
MPRRRGRSSALAARSTSYCSTPVAGRRRYGAVARASCQAIEHGSGVVAARRLEAMKADFYSMITHDLRNPAGKVLVALEMLLAGKSGALELKQANLVQLAFRSAEKFVGLPRGVRAMAKRRVRSSCPRGARG